MITYFSHIPTALFGVLIVGAFVWVSLLGLWVFKLLPRNRLGLSPEMNNDIIFFASAISAFYGLTVGLISVGVWDSYNQVQGVVSGEASSIAALYRDVSGYPEPTAGELQKEIHEYIEIIIQKVWPAQYEGIILSDGTLQLNKIQRMLFAFEPSTLGQQSVHSEALRQFNHMVELRRLRVEAVRGGLPSVMWGVVVIGAMLSISVTYLMHIERTVHIVLTAFLATFTGLVVFVIAGLDSALSGPLAISPDSYRLILDTLINVH